jgi:hypothetical protein
MGTFILASYILVWPIISSVVLGVIVFATLKDFRVAKHEGREVV